MKDNNLKSTVKTRVIKGELWVRVYALFWEGDERLSKMGVEQDEEEAWKTEYYWFKFSNLEEFWECDRDGFVNAQINGRTWAIMATENELLEIMSTQ